MVQCEMCGKETPSPRTVKVEGAELEVCEECADFGTEVDQGGDSGTTSTKYSTSSTGSSGSSSTSRSSGSSGSSSSGGRRRGDEMFDDVAGIATDYDDRIRDAREAAGMSQEDLAKKLNEKASLIAKLERGDTLPSDEVQRELEGELGISLSAGESGEETSEWEADADTGEYTLGDMVERKD